MWQRTSPGLSLSLFSSFLLHWLRSTRDPRRRTRLGWSRTHTHTPERSHTAPPECGRCGRRESSAVDSVRGRERETHTHTRTWRASLHSHSSSTPLHGGRDGHVQSHALSLHRWRTYIASVLMVEEGPSALVCGRPHYLGRQVSYHAPRKQLTTLRAAPLLPSRALGV